MTIDVVMSPPPDYCLLWIQAGICMPRSDWAAWVQAIGSILAILAGAGFVLWQNHLQARRDWNDKLDRMDVVLAILLTSAREAAAINKLLSSRTAVYEIARRDRPFDWHALDRICNALEVIPLHELQLPLAVIEVRIATNNLRQLRYNATGLLQHHESVDADGFETAFQGFSEAARGCAIAYNNLFEHLAKARQIGHFPTDEKTEALPLPEIR